MEAAALGGRAGGTWLFNYRKKYEFDIFREDIRDLVELAVGKMAR